MTRALEREPPNKSIGLIFIPHPSTGSIVVGGGRRVPLLGVVGGYGAAAVLAALVISQGTYRDRIDRRLIGLIRRQ